VRPVPWERPVSMGSTQETTVKVGLVAEMSPTELARVEMARVAPQADAVPRVAAVATGELEAEVVVAPSNYSPHP